MKWPALEISETIVTKTFRDTEIGGGAGGINAICSRPEVVDDVISCYNVETFRDFQAANL